MIVAKAPGSKAYNDFMNAAAEREQQRRQQLITKEYSLDGDEKALKELLASEGHSLKPASPPPKKPSK